MKTLSRSSIILLFCFVCSCVHAQIITTVAGVYDSILYNGDSIAATAVHLANPGNVIVDGAGNYYITDTYHNRVRKVNSAGIITTVAGTGMDTLGGYGGFSGDGGPATAAQLNGPLGMVFDHAGNMYVADNYNNRVRKISADGIITTIAGTDSAGYNGDNIPATAAWLNSPHFIALDAAENLYICDMQNSRIRKIDGSGIITTVAGTGVAGFSGDGGAATQAQINNPYGIAIDDEGNIYFSDYLEERIRKIDASGIITTIAGNGHASYNGDHIPATSAWLFYPCAVIVDNGHNVYFADANNFRIRRVDNYGIITTIAGSGSSIYSGDLGPATSAGIGLVTSLAINSSGDLYIAGFITDVIRLVRHAVSIENVNAPVNEIDLYPNPNNGEFTVQAHYYEDVAIDIFVTDVTGRAVYRQQATANHAVKIKLDRYAGVYFVTMHTAQNTSTQKIIVE